MSSSDIILVGEKRPIEKFMYKIWPGDEKASKYQENNYYISNKPSQVSNLENDDSFKTEKRKREDGHNQERLVNSKWMKNRYFSEKNLKKTSESSKIEIKQTNLINTDEFNRRNDYITQRLLRNRTLPGIEKGENKDLVSAEQNSDIIEIKVSKPVRTNEFQEEFIPLFSTDRNKNKEDHNDQNNLSHESTVYYGPYPFECMEKVTEAIIEAFKPIEGATYTNRAAEIAKMKVRLPSKFDKDTRLWRRIKRDSYQIRQELKDKIENCKRHEHLMNSKKKNKKIYFVELDQSSDTDFSQEVANKRKKIKTKNKFDDIEDQNLNDCQIRLENLDDSDMDSKYAQFSKYSKKNSKENQQKNAKKNKDILKSEIEKFNDDDSELNPYNQVEMLKKQYRRLQSERSRSINLIEKNEKDESSKKISIEIEKNKMKEKMTEVWRQIKKITKKYKIKVNPKKKKVKKVKESNLTQASQSNCQNVNKKKKKKQKKNKKKNLNQNQSIKL